MGVYLGLFDLLHHSVMKPIKKTKEAMVGIFDQLLKLLSYIKTKHKLPVVLCGNLKSTLPPIPLKKDELL